MRELRIVSLNDAQLRLKRGAKQLNELIGILAEEFDPKNTSIGFTSRPYKKPIDESDKRNWYAYAFFLSDLPKVAKGEGILIGQIIQGFRSSLDYLAWSTVMHYGENKLIEAEKRRVCFPMERNQTQFWKKVKTSLPNLSKKQRMLFEHYQPYKRSDAGRAIRHLKILSNYDKHRIILPAFVWPKSGVIDFELTNLDIVKEIGGMNIIGKIVNIDTKITTLILAEMLPGKEVNVVPKITVGLTPVFPRHIIQPTSSEVFVEVQQALEHIHKVCGEVLIEAKNYFPKLEK